MVTRIRIENVAALRSAMHEASQRIEDSLRYGWATGDAFEHAPRPFGVAEHKPQIGRAVPFYRTDERGVRYCLHGVMLHGVTCTRCEADKAGAIDMPVRPPRAYP